NGRPSRSSSRPGASPTNMMRASGFPSANTSCVAVDFSAQPSNFSISARSASSVGAMRAASRADAIAPSGAGGPASPGNGGGGGGRCGGGGLLHNHLAKGRLGIGEAVDRLLAKRAIDARLQVEGQQLPNIGGIVGRQLRHSVQFTPHRAIMKRISMVVLPTK